MTWRDRAVETITSVIKANKGKPTTEVVKAIRDSYPFGQRDCYPYKVWLQCVREVTIELEKLEAWENGN